MSSDKRHKISHFFKPSTRDKEKTTTTTTTVQNDNTDIPVADVNESQPTYSPHVP